MISKLAKYIPLIFLVVCIFIILDGLISIVEIHALTNDYVWVAHTYTVIHQANAIAKATVLTETSVEDYLLSGDKQQILAYNTDWNTIQTGIKNLIRLTNDNSSEEKRVEILQQYLQKQKMIFDNTIQTYNTSGLSTVQALIVKGQGRQEREAVQHQVTDIDNVENALLVQRSNQFVVRTLYMYATTFGSALLGIALLIFTYIVITREFARRTQLEQKKNEFINLASHELKTPITSLSLYTELLLQRLSTPKNRSMQAILQKMRTEVAETKNLINDLLDVTRIQLGKLELQKDTFNLHELVSQTVDEIKLTTKKHQFTIRGQKTVRVFADRQRIWQVITNLLTNAVKYSPNGGRITITLDRKRTRVLLSIRDQGLGISIYNIPRVFDRYFREEGNEQKKISGLGLGLYLSKEIIDLHKGHIWVRSKEGQGTTFFFTLPLTRKKLRTE